MGEVREGTRPLAQLSASFQSLPATLLVAANWALLVLILGRCICVYSKTPWVSPTNSPVRLGVPPATTTLTGFIARGFEALFPCTGTLGCMVCLTPQLFLLIYPHANVGLPATTLPSALSAPPAAHLHPSYQSG